MLAVIKNNDFKINGIGWEKISASLNNGTNVLKNNDKTGNNNVNSISKKEMIANHEQEKVAKFIANLADDTHPKLSHEDRLKNAKIEIEKLEKNNKSSYQKIVNQTDDWLRMLEEWVYENRAMQEETKQGETNDFALYELERAEELLINKQANPLWYDSIIDKGFYLFSEWVYEFLKSSPNDPYYQYINNGNDVDYYPDIHSYYGNKEFEQNGIDSDKKKEIALKNAVQRELIQLSKYNQKKYQELITKMTKIKKIQEKLEQLKKKNLVEYKKLIERTRNFIDNKISELNKKHEKSELEDEADRKERELAERKVVEERKLAEKKAEEENAIEFMAESPEYYGQEREKPFYARREQAEKKLDALKIENKKKYDEILKKASSRAQQRSVEQATKAREEKLAQLPAEFMADSPDYFGSTANSENYNSRLAKANNKLAALKKDPDQKPYEEMIKKMHAWIALEEKNAIQFLLTTNDEKYRLFSPQEAEKRRIKYDPAELNESNHEAAKKQLAEYYQTDLAKYQDILNRGRSAANTPRALEAIERTTPVQAPSQPTGRFRDNGEFIALSIMSCVGPFSTKMHAAFENAGDTISGKFIAAKQQLEFYYEVTCVPYQPDARDITAFVSEIHNTFSVSYNPKTNASKPADIIHCVNTSYVTHSIHTYIAYQKKGTCRIKARYDKENLKVKVENSPQYAEEKEMMPVRYRKGA